MEAEEGINYIIPDVCLRNGRLLTKVTFGCKGSYVATYSPGDRSRNLNGKKSPGKPRDSRNLCRWDLRGQYEGLEKYLQGWQSSPEEDVRRWERT